MSVPLCSAPPPALLPATLLSTSIADPMMALPNASAGVTMPMRDGVPIKEGPTLDEVAMKIGEQADRGYYLPSSTGSSSPPRASASSVGITLLRGGEAEVPFRYASGNGLSFVVHGRPGEESAIQLPQRVALPRQMERLDMDTVFDVAELVATSR